MLDKIKKFYSLAIIFLLVLGTIFFIPFHMDEFVMFHWLACLEPSQQQNLYRENCQAYPMHFFGLTYFQSYQYIGITSSLLAWPFFSIWNSTWTNYVIGIVYLCLAVLGLQKSFKWNRKDAQIAFVFFPILFTVLHDGGPVRLSLVTMAWTPFLFEKFLTSKNKFNFLWVFLASILWVLSVEDKPFFIFLIPGLILLILASIFMKFQNEFISKNKIKILSAIIYLLLNVVLFLFIVRAGESSYFNYLRSVSNSPVTEFVVTGKFQEFAKVATSAILGAIQFLFFWPFFAHRTMVLEELKLSFLSFEIPGFSNPYLVVASICYLLCLLGVIFLNFRLLKNFKNRNFSYESKLSSILLILSIISLIIIPALAGGWTSHHFVFFQVAWLILVIYLSVNKRFLGVLIAVITALSIIAIKLTPVDDKSSLEIKKVFSKAIEVSNKDSVISCTSWGCFYQYSLLNKKNIPVVFVTPEVPEHFGQLEKKIITEKKQLLILCQNCSKQNLDSYFSKIRFQQLETQTKTWFLFKSESVSD